MDTETEQVVLVEILANRRPFDAGEEVKELVRGVAGVGGAVGFAAPLSAKASSAPLPGNGKSAGNRATRGEAGDGSVGVWFSESPASDVRLQKSQDASRCEINDGK